MRQVKKKLRLLLRKQLATRLGLDRDRKLARAYLAEAGSRKLHLGCGRHVLPGWLNADYYPKTGDILHLDATKRLPFDDDSFDFIFSEHMIEHFSFVDGVGLVEECHRVLGDGGVLRLSTPDLAFLIEIYRSEKDSDDRSAAQEAFLRHFIDTEFGDRESEAPTYYDTFLINKFVREWGHLFVYDAKTLRWVLERAGFTDIVRHEVQESERPELERLENVGRKPDGHIALESMVLEATKS